ncbi:MAG: hypothetical protein S4CHLAM20_08520 [Chlamydiia bacterium]|nr:hypothetical protein [Chlamydiia bacterium]
MAELKVYTVFLPVKQRKMLKLFQKITDPTSRIYSQFACHNYFDERWEESARNYFKKFKGAALRKTCFPGVLRLITTKQERDRHFVPPFYRVKEEKDFDQIEQAVAALNSSESVHVLEGDFEASRKLKKRVNLALMDLAIQGETILSPVDSFFGEMPALTSFNSGYPPRFSEHFKRKKYARYQDFLVKNYLLDPLIVAKLKQLDHYYDGRAYPDITLNEPEVFLETLKAVNKKRLEQKKPYIGFLNPVLYSNARIFRRNVNEERYGFPFSVTLWRPNIGLGEPQLDRFESLF